MSLIEDTTISDVTQMHLKTSLKGEAELIVENLLTIDNNFVLA